MVGVDDGASDGAGEGMEDGVLEMEWFYEFSDEREGVKPSYFID